MIAIRLSSIQSGKTTEKRDWMARGEKNEKIVDRVSGNAENSSRKIIVFRIRSIGEKICKIYVAPKNEQ